MARSTLPYSHEVAYIERPATARGLTYIKTGVHSTDTTKLTGTFAIPTTLVVANVFRTDKSNTLALVINNGGDRFTTAYGRLGHTPWYGPTGRGGFITMSMASGVISRNGVVGARESVLDVAEGDDREIQFFGHDDVSWYGAFVGKWKSFQISLDGRTVDRDYYPVVTNEGKPAFYDRIHGEIVEFTGDTSELIVGYAVHTHDWEFEVDAPEKLNNLPADTVVLTDFDLSRGYVLYEGSSLPDVNGDVGAIVLGKQIGAYQIGQQLVLVKSSTGNYWYPVGTPVAGVTAPFNVRSHRTASTRVVKIRWQDPRDVEDASGTVIRRWKYTRVLRKLGGYPQSMYDGVIVTDNAQRDYYNERMLTDVQPPDITGVWYYRMFAVSEDGVAVSSEKSSFVPVELNWSNISTYIQAGQGPSIFGIGDVIEFGKTDDPVYSKLQLTVTGFDVAVPSAPSRYRHTISFTSRFILADLPFDVAWGDYRLVDDEVVVAGLKRYYVYSDALGGYTLATPQPANGYHITSDDGYYTVILDNRSLYGSNAWADCALRKWLNAPSEYTYVQTTDKTINASKTYYSKNPLSGLYDKYDASRGGNPSSLGLFERGEKLTFFGDKSFSIKPPLAALHDDIDSALANLIISVANVTALSVDNPALESVSSTRTNDMVYLPSITELTGVPNEISEGKQVTYYEEDITRIKRSKAVGQSATSWWLRSPRVKFKDDGATPTFTLRTVTGNGEFVDTDVMTVSGSSSIQTRLGVGISLTIG